MSYVAGGLFAIAWWLWIDAHAFSSKFEENGVYVTFPIYLPGIFSTVAMIMLQLVSWEDLGGSSWAASEDTGRQNRVRIFFFLSLVIAFGGIIAALWIAIEHWFNHVPAPTYIYPAWQRHQRRSTHQQHNRQSQYNRR